MAIAAGMEQTLSLKNSNNKYRKIVVSRPVQPLGKDIGFLPGTMEEKMLPWLMPIQDNLKFLMGDRSSLEMYMEKGKIEVEALTYIRGRSISNAFVIFDGFCSPEGSWEVPAGGAEPTGRLLLLMLMRCYHCYRSLPVSR